MREAIGRPTVALEFLRQLTQCSRSGGPLAENLLIVVIVEGFGFRPPALVAGIAAAAVMYSLAGFVAAVRYDSINEMLFPTIVWITAFSVPILHYAGLWTTPLIYAHPFQAPLVLLKGGFAPLEAWEWAYGVGYSIAWITVGFAWSQRAFQRFVVEAVGGS